MKYEGDWIVDFKTDEPTDIPPLQCPYTFYYSGGEVTIKVLEYKNVKLINDEMIMSCEFEILEGEDDFNKYYELNI